MSIQKSTNLQLNLFENSVVFVERNIDTNSLFIFPSYANDSALLRETRKMDLQIQQGPQGERTRQIVIEPTTKQHSYNYLTSQVYVALTMLWRERGCPDDPQGWDISLTDICKKLKCSRNSERMKDIRDQLATLNKTNMTFTECWKFKNKDSAETEVSLNILSVYKQLTRKTKSGEIVNSKIVVQFHPTIIQSLEVANVVPKNWETMISIGDPQSTCFFAHIDRILAGLIFETKDDQVIWSRNMLGVVADMALPKESYEFPYQRKRLGDRLAKYLNKKALSVENVVLDIKCIKAAKHAGQQTDYKLVCTTIGKPTRKLKLVNSSTMSNDLFQNMFDLCEAESGTPVDNKSVNTLRKFSQMYTHQVIFTAISETRLSIQQGKQNGKPIYNVGGLLVDNIKRIDAAGKATAAAAKLALAAT